MGKKKTRKRATGNEAAMRAKADQATAGMDM